MLRKAAGFLAIAVTLGSCGSVDPSTVVSTAESDAPTGLWTVIVAQDESLAGGTIVLDLSSNQIRGDLFCNEIWTGSDWEDGRFSLVGQGDSTLVSCGRSEDRIADAVLLGFQRADRWNQKDDQITLLSPQGTELVLQPWLS